MINGHCRQHSPDRESGKGGSKRGGRGPLLRSLMGGGGLSCRPDTRTFLVLFMVFNVLLAVFNILSFRLSSRDRTTPCVVVVGPNFSDKSFHSHHHGDKESDAFQQDSAAARQATDAASSAEQQQVPSPFQTSPGNYSAAAEYRGNYIVIPNYLPGVQLNQVGYNDSVTYTTQGTYEFLRHVETLCQRWDGPVSVSVYAPGADLPVAIRTIIYLRLCHHSCILKNVSWHLIYDKNHGPSPENLPIPEDVSAILGEPVSCDSTSLINLSSDYRQRHNMPYPINLARNVARLQAKTHYILASDIELYPSVNTVSRFLNLTARLAANPNLLQPPPSNNSRYVYVLPIFEVQKGLEAPKTKAQLLPLLQSGKAVYFHKWVCDACQNFPLREKWIKTLPSGGNETLNVFLVTRRQRPRTSWEPIYIGTKDDPLYDERLTWEGKRDKMSQVYEMCLMGYDFRILDTAFLVHAPGIKQLSNKDQQKRMPYIRKNNALYPSIESTLRKKHGPNSQC